MEASVISLEQHLFSVSNEMLNKQSIVFELTNQLFHLHLSLLVAVFKFGVSFH